MAKQENTLMANGENSGGLCSATCADSTQWQWFVRVSKGNYGNGH